MSDVDESEVLLVDLHKHDLQNGPEKEVLYGSSEADLLKRHFDDFRDLLDDAPLYDYAAGFAVRRTDQDVAAIVESVDGQEVLLMGIDTNGITPDVRELAADYRESFDEVLVFSTDTHASIHELANTTRSDTDRVADRGDRTRHRRGGSRDDRPDQPDNPPAQATEKRLQRARVQRQHPDPVDGHLARDAVRAARHLAVLLTTGFLYSALLKFLDRTGIACKIHRR